MQQLPSDRNFNAVFIPQLFLINRQANVVKPKGGQPNHIVAGKELRPFVASSGALGKPMADVCASVQDESRFFVRARSA